MTTTIKVSTAAHPAQVLGYNHPSGDLISEDHVEPHSTRDFHVHEGKVITVTEWSEGKQAEVPAPAVAFPVA